MQFSNDPNKLGNKLGPKLVQVISDTIVATKRKLLDTEHRARVHSMQTIIDQAGREIADLYRPVWDSVVADAEIEPVIKEHIDKIMSGRHQWQAVAGLALGYSGAGSALGTIISNYLAPVVRTAVARAPELLPSPETLVQLGTKGAMDWPSVRDYAHGAGYADFTIDALRDGSYLWPDVTTTLELMRRGLINQAQAANFLTRNGVAPEAHGVLMSLAFQLVSPADLADMVVRGIKTESEATNQAARSGVEPRDFHDLTLLTGEPPGLMQMLEGYRRGFIDRATLVHGIRQSRYRDEWIPLLEALRFEPMSVADAVNATVQNHMSASRMNAIAEQNGLEPGSADILLETAGEPLSRTEMQELYNRGLATRQQVDQAQRESRLKDKYIPLSFELHAKILPVYTLQRALRYGGVDHATAVTIAMESGYTKRDAEIIVNAGSAEKLQSHRDRVVTAIETAYEDNTIPKGDALTLITQMGYDKSEAEFVLESADFRKMARIVTQVSNAVRSKYIGRHITRQQASNDIDAIGIPSQQRDFMLGLWDIELEANTRHLTEAQVVKAVNKKLITETDGQRRLVAMGYSLDDATLLLNGA